MIKPVNNHILIEPLKTDSFISSDKGTYEEVGIVIDYSDELSSSVDYNNGAMNANYHDAKVKVGDKVYFDSWLAAKFPKNNKEYFWLVKWEDVRAIETE